MGHIADVLSYPNPHTEKFTDLSVSLEDELIIIIHIHFRICQTGAVAERATERMERGGGNNGNKAVNHRNRIFFF